MHRQIKSLLSSGGSPGRLAQYAQALADAGVNIRAIGGAEWEHTGAVAVLVDGDSDEAIDAAVRAANDAGFPSESAYCAEAVLADEPGSLARAAEDIGDLNITTILVPDTHVGVGLVSFGFATDAEAEEARKRLGERAVAAHQLTRAWQAHEQWDRENPNQPPPDPKSA